MDEGSLNTIQVTLCDAHVNRATTEGNDKSNIICLRIAESYSNRLVIFYYTFRLSKDKSNYS